MDRGGGGVSLLQIGSIGTAAIAQRSANVFIRQHNRTIIIIYYDNKGNNVLYLNFFGRVTSEC